MSHTVLFVGGPRDGVLSTVEELRPVFSVDVWVGGGWYFGNVGSVSVVDYHLLPLRGEKQSHPLYVVHGMTADETISRLIVAYNDQRNAAGKSR